MQTLSHYEKNGLDIKMHWQGGLTDSKLVAIVSIDGEERIDVLNDKEIYHILSEANRIVGEKGQNPSCSKPFDEYAQIYYSMIV